MRRSDEAVRESVAVDGLSFRVTDGQVFGFLGPNGSGKTTTMRMLLRADRADCGPCVGERTAAARTPDGLSSIGAMIEEPAFYPWMTGRKNLAVLALCGPPLGRTIDTIEVVVGPGCPHRRSRIERSIPIRRGCVSGLGSRAH